MARVAGQAESVRRLTGTLLLSLRDVVLCLGAAVIGLAVLAPRLALVCVVAALALLAWQLRPLAAIHRDAVRAGETLAAETRSTVRALRGIMACAAGAQALTRIGATAERQAALTRALARADVGRGAAVAVGGHLPVVLMLTAAPSLTSGSAMPAGTLAGAATYPYTQVTQDSYVFDGTLREDLTCLRPDGVSDEELDRSMAALGAIALVARVGGYEARVEQAFGRREGSLVVIARRMSSALRADRIVVLDGTCATEGTHDDSYGPYPPTRIWQAIGPCPSTVVQGRIMTARRRAVAEPAACPEGARRAPAAWWSHRDGQMKAELECGWPWRQGRPWHLLPVPGRSTSRSWRAEQGPSVRTVVRMREDRYRAAGRFRRNGQACAAVRTTSHDRTLNRVLGRCTGRG
ncbi:hypothetical protein [Streptomyces sp. AN091965]|uniref:hypothetical protein n=1 Tax=Streptomyces sp. AN091965 TaxID=2927803 RepID=UPI001F6214B9|nr:hypothetical protein [Streptomyces sp. AN091965]MCI3928042.1 hypothetical protein [Streptomyces sp. AN091965]